MSDEREALARATADRILAAGWRRSPAPAVEPWNPATSPGMTDMMVPPETLAAYMEANPLPADAAVTERAREITRPIADALRDAAAEVDALHPIRRDTMRREADDAHRRQEANHGR